MLSLLDLYDNLTSRMPGFAQFICCTPSTVNGKVLPTAGFTFPSDTNSIIFSSCSILVLEFKDIAVTLRSYVTLPNLHTAGPDATRCTRHYTLPQQLGHLRRLTSFSPPADANPTPAFRLGRFTIRTPRSFCKPPSCRW